MMNYNKNHHTNLAVYREGELDQEHYVKQARQERIQAILSHFQAILAAFAQPFRNLAYNVRKELSLALFDALHGTNYRDRWHQRLEELRRERFEATLNLF